MKQYFLFIAALIAVLFMGLGKDDHKHIWVESVADTIRVEIPINTLGIIKYGMRKGPELVCIKCFQRKTQMVDYWMPEYLNIPAMPTTMCGNAGWRMRILNADDAFIPPKEAYTTSGPLVYKKGKSSNAICHDPVYYYDGDRVSFDTTPLLGKSKPVKHNALPADSPKTSFYIGDPKPFKNNGGFMRINNDSVKTEPTIEFIIRSSDVHSDPPKHKLKISNN